MGNHSDGITEASPGKAGVTPAVPVSGGNTAARRLGIVLRLSLKVLAAWIVLLFLLFPDAGQLLAANWIIIPISVVAAAFANATAVGGGFLFIPLFIFGYGLPALAALKLGLATQAFGMSSGAIGWSRSFIVPGALLIACLGSGLGMYVGTYNLVPDNQAIKAAFGWISLFIFVAILLEIRFSDYSHNTVIRNDGWLKRLAFFALSFAGGLITAWTAIGIGEVVALYLLFVYRLRIETAIATGVAALAVNSILGLAFHTHIGGIRWDLLAFTAPGVLIGGYTGARFGRLVESWVRTRRPQGGGPAVSNHSPLKWLFATVVLVDGVAMLAQTYLSGG